MVRSALPTRVVRRLRAAALREAQRAARQGVSSVLRDAGVRVPARLSPRFRDHLENDVTAAYQLGIQRADAVDPSLEVRLIIDRTGQRIEGLMRLAATERQANRERKLLGLDPIREGVRDRAGRVRTVDELLRLAVLDAISRAHTQGALDSGRDLKYAGDNPCDHHPRDPHHPCRALTGRRYRAGMPLPPFHFRCSHFLEAS